MTSGSPHFDVLIGDVEMRRHDADDGAADAVDLDLRSDDVRAAAERRLPHLVATASRPAGRSARVSAGFERAADMRVHAERREQLGRRLRRVDAARAVGRGQVRLAGRERADARRTLRVRSWNSRNSGGDTQNWSNPIFGNWLEM